MTRSAMVFAAAMLGAFAGTAATARPTTPQTSTVQYRCLDGRAIAVTYHFQAPRPYALVRVDGRVRRLDRIDTGDEADTTFKRGRYTLIMPGLAADTVYQAGDGGIMRSGVTRATDAGTQYLFRGCVPRRRR